MADTCIFCGHQGPNRDFPPEHWVPEWLNRKLFPAYGAGVRHNFPDTSWDADVFELVVSHVCGQCNHSWLSDIEAKAARYVFPLIVGIAGEDTINPQGLFHVARWCYLKALSLELSRPEEHVPTHDPSVYAAFKKAKKPPYPNCSLALGIRYIEETAPVFVWFASQGGVQFASIPPSPSSLEGYHTTLLIGHLVVDVFGTSAPVNVNVDHGEGFNVLWPVAHTGGRFTWPPKKRFRWGEDGLELG